MARRQRGGGLANQVAVRFPDDLLEKLERYTERLRQERPGLSVTRADVIRMLVHERLAEIEADEPAK